jgi:hypothetical protein
MVLGQAKCLPLWGLENINRYFKLLKHGKKRVFSGSATYCPESAKNVLIPLQAVKR